MNKFAVIIALSAVLVGLVAISSASGHIVKRVPKAEHPEHEGKVERAHHHPEARVHHGKAHQQHPVPHYYQQHRRARPVHHQQPYRRSSYGHQPQPRPVCYYQCPRNGHGRQPEGNQEGEFDHETEQGGEVEQGGRGRQEGGRRRGPNDQEGETEQGGRGRQEGGRRRGPNDQEGEQEQGGEFEQEGETEQGGESEQGGEPEQGGEFEQSGRGRQESGRRRGQTEQEGESEQGGRRRGSFKAVGGFGGFKKENESDANARSKVNQKNRNQFQRNKGVFAGEQKNFNAGVSTGENNSVEGFHRQKSNNNDRLVVKETNRGNDEAAAFRKQSSQNQEGHVGASDNKFFGANAGESGSSDQESEKDFEADVHRKNSAEGFGGAGAVKGQF